MNEQFNSALKEGLSGEVIGSLLGKNLDNPKLNTSGTNEFKTGFRKVVEFVKRPTGDLKVTLSEGIAPEQLARTFNEDLAAGKDIRFGRELTARIKGKEQKLALQEKPPMRRS